jgi:hypothetical protein
VLRVAARSHGQTPALQQGRRGAHTSPDEMYAGENDGGVVPVQPTLGGGATPAAAVDTTAESSRVANISACSKLLPVALVAWW